MMKTLQSLFLLVVFGVQQFQPILSLLPLQDTGGTETSTVVETETETPTLTPTLTATITPEEFLPTPSETPSPTTSETLLPTSTVTPTETPTGTPTSTPTETLNVLFPDSNLALAAAPPFIMPGQQINIHWRAKLDLPEPHDMLIRLSPGLEMADGMEKDPETGLYRLPGDKNGRFLLAIAEDVILPAYIDAWLVPAGTGIDFFVEKTSLTLMEKQDISAMGGEARGMKDKVRVIFPANALPEEAAVIVQHPRRETLPPFSLSGQPVEIIAFDTKGERKISQFDDQVEIVIDFSEMGIPEEYEGELYLYFYNTETGQWDSLPTRVDQEANLLYARTTHFTVFDISVSNWQASRVPSVENFQVADFTGAGTFNLPLKVPPGPGGLQPNLNLTYNSMVVDQATMYTQASPVGMGWSLEPGAIYRNGYGTTSFEQDDVFLLNINGVSSQIFQDANGQYHLADENFRKIEKQTSPNRWVVWDKQGNTYYFEYTLKMAYAIPSTYSGAEECEQEARFLDYEWSLTRVRNRFGQELIYNYTKDSKAFYYEIWKPSRNDCRTEGVVQTDTASYLSAITYANNTARVRLEWTPRTDYTLGWPFNSAQHTFSLKKISKVLIELDTNDDGVFETVPHYYDFEYATDNNNQIWPGVTWAAGGKTLTLTGVREYGLGGQPSPTYYQFTYGDQMHLTRVDNGLGGVVEFTYDPYVYTERAAKPYVKLDRVNWPGDPAQGLPGGSCVSGAPGWFGAMTAQDYVECVEDGVNTNKWELAVSGQGNVVTSSGPTLNLVRPGGFYKVSGSAWDHPSVVIGMWDGVTPYWTPNAGDVFKLPPDRNKVELLFGNPNGSASYNIAWGKLELLTAIYRVEQKTIQDGRGNQYAYSYDYAGGAVNDINTTTAYCPLQSGTNGVWGMQEDVDCREYTPKFSEFRGHAQVTQVGPDGRTTITAYHQDDVLRGRPQTIQVRDGYGNLLSEQLFEYTTVNLPITPPKPNGHWWLVFLGPQRNWIYTSAVENRTYDSSGIYTATRTTYTYESTYGNLVSSQEFSWEGSAWQLYRQSNTDYFPNSASGVHLVGLPARQQTLSASGQVLAEQLFLYDGAQSYTSAPSQGILTATRQWVNGTSYSQVSYGYDSWGNTTSQTAYSGYGAASAAPTAGARTTTTAFDPVFHVFPIQQTNPLGHITRWQYDYTHGLPNSETDPNGAVTTAQYDAFGRMVKLIRPGDSAASPTLLFSYDDNFPLTASLTQKIDATRSFTATRKYDGMGRMFQSIAGGVITDFQYDAYGRTISQSTPHVASESSFFTTTSYDVLGRPLTILAPDGSQTSFAYNGLQTTQTDPKGNSTITMSDVWGRTVSVTPPTGPGITYAYDELGQLVSAAKSGNVTSLVYDRAGRKISMDDPDMGQWSYTYDALGNLTSQVDARGCTLALGYDLLGRLTGKSSSGSGCGVQISSSYIYDVGTFGKGRRTGMLDASGGSAWAYDARGRVISDLRTFGGNGSYATSWTYNSADLPVTQTYPDGEVVEYTYDARMLLEGLAGVDVYLSNATYDSAGRMTARQYGNGLSQAFNYYDWDQQGGRLQAVITGSLQGLSYSYDLNGNILSILDAVDSETQSFSYDSLDRLTAATVTGGPAPYAETYTYDPLTGSLATKAGVALTYNDASHVHAVTGMGSNIYSYDANGNQVSRYIDGDGSYTLLYDAENRLVEVKKAGQTVAEFTYNGDGQRVIAVENGETTLFVGAVEIRNPQQGTPPGNPTPSPTPTETASPTPTATPTENFVPGSMVSVNNWNFNTFAEGWGSPNSSVTGFGWQTGGYVGGNIVGNTPRVSSGDYLGYNINTAKYLVIRLKNNTSGTQARIRFITDADGSYNSTKQVYFAVQPNSDYTEYLVDMSNIAGWNGTLRQLRFYPPDALGSFSIDYVRINLDPKWLFTTTTENWGSPSSSITDFGWQNGGYIGGNIISSDPIIYSVDNLGLPLGSNKIIKLRYRNLTGSTSARLYFMTNADPTWTEAKSITFTTHPYSGYVEYTLDFTSMASFTGTLKRLRFHPASTTGAFNLDSVRIGSLGVASTPTPTVTFTPTATATSTPMSINPGLTNLKAWWSMDETGGTRNDSHGTNHLSDYNTVMSAAGIRGNAADFEDTNSEYLNVADNPNISTGDVNFTICLWARPESSGNGGIITKWQGTSNREFAMRLNSSTKPDFFTANNSGNSGVTHANAISPGQWYFICGQYDTVADQTRISVNGSNWTSAAVGHIPSDSTYPLHIGWDVNVGYFDGLIDEVVFYKSLLTMDNVTYLYNQGNGRQYCEVSGSCATPTPTATNTATPTLTPTITPTITPTASPTASPTPTTPPFDYNGTWTKHYMAGAQRIALRTCTGTSCTAAMYILADHLGSASIVTDSNGAVVSEVKYKAWGEERHNSGALPTDYTYTGQYSYMGGIGLMYYNARWYDPYTNRFTQADSIIPGVGNPQAWNRYAYVLNNPLKYNDPSGHIQCAMDVSGLDYCYPNGEKPFKSAATSVFDKPIDDSLDGNRGDDEIIFELNSEPYSPNSGVPAMALVLDTIAAGLNGIYAFLTYIAPPFTPVMLNLYQYYSILPNGISTISGGIVVANDFMIGANNLTISQSIVDSSNQTITAEISSDTVVAMSSNFAGWTILREPIIATVADALVVGYDNFSVRGIVAPIQISVSVNTYNGWSFGISSSER